MPDFRQERSEYGGPKNHAGQKLSEDGRLPEAAHPFPKHAANEEEEDQLGGQKLPWCAPVPRTLTLFQLAR